MQTKLKNVNAATTVSTESDDVLFNVTPKKTDKRKRDRKLYMRNYRARQPKVVVLDWSKTLAAFGEAERQALLQQQERISDLSWQMAT